MTDKEAIKIFKEIWTADIITQAEPEYSIANAVMEKWTSQPVCCPCPGMIPDLTQILAEKLKRHWTNILIRQINMAAPAIILDTDSLEGVIATMKLKYKHSKVILELVEKIARTVIKDNDLTKACEYV